MTEALIYFGASTAVLSILTTLYLFEDMRGGRVILPRTRNAFDGLLRTLAHKLGLSRVFLRDGFFRLIMHYSVHTILATILHFIRGLEQRIENVVRRNKKAAKDITSQKQNRTHLDEIADHKNEVALSEDEKEKMRSQ